VSRITNNSAFASSERKAYRFNGLYRWYHFIVGAVFLVVAVLVRDLYVVSIPIALLAAFMIARPLRCAVMVDQYSVTLKGVFSENSLPRSSITAIRRVSTGKGTSLMFCSNTEATEGLSIGVNLIAFDQAWDDWLGTFRDLSSDRPLSLFDKSA
jgi:hypothetical protein